ncbi:Uncharacterised nucleotidyltransferase [Methylomagnum ishizawai]|uniref:Uncharacterized nucleotidyltransferase n=1 Tax=Methylomagnum ishizawai TaxID=1760988 RepID=A0A1Y6D248_9GAMM|nr:nucleotidyltransferase family protein [Methylomagnum ishizawai]SMF96656.1 Uncharacterised nucleotidyltransferase [Methylomagnum ishizawai]
MNTQPDFSLLLETARPQLSGHGERLLSGAGSGYSESDWAWLIRQALDHGTAGLLCHHMAALGAASGDMAAACQTYLETCAASFASGLGELRELLDKLEVAGVDAMPIKGPGLACRVYANPELRRFRDLDLLIRPAHRDAALTVLAALGYRGTLEDLPPSRLRDYHEYNGQDILFAPDRTPLEPHWALAPWTFCAGIDVDALFARTVEFEAPGLGRVRGLSPEDTLLVAAVHGSKEEWSRLIWLSDIAAIFAAWPMLDARLALERATACGCRRMLLLAVLLAQRLVGAEVPIHLVEQALADPAIPGLAAHVERNLPLSQGETRDVFRLTRFRWRVRERVADRIRYGLRTLLTPRVPHFRMLALPDRLAFLYPVARIVIDVIILPIWRIWKRIRRVDCP